MENIFTDSLTSYLENSFDEACKLLETIATIPAPSHHEEKRAEFIKSWLIEQGADGVYIDEALNVIYPINCENNKDLIVFAAHTDIVFPDTEPIKVTRDDQYYYAPGIGDDTTCLVQMLIIIKYIIKNNIKPGRGVLFVANSCEEGLGNLKGTKQLMKDFDGIITEFYTFDGKYPNICNKCVGSHRYEIECLTEGGHSFNAFGKANAIHKLSELICDLFTVEVPVMGDSKTTYNVGVIEGGTSVNTIAQKAKVLYEYRSDNIDCLEIMKNTFEEKINKANQASDLEFKVNILGIRPCGGKIDEVKHKEMCDRVLEIQERHSGMKGFAKSGSTDCNIPMSLGVPAVCCGNYLGDGTHTREERIVIESLKVGLKITAEIILGLF